MTFLNIIIDFQGAIPGTILLDEVVVNGRDQPLVVVQDLGRVHVDQISHLFPAVLGIDPNKSVLFVDGIIVTGFTEPDIGSDVTGSATALTVIVVAAGTDSVVVGFLLGLITSAVLKYHGLKPETLISHKVLFFL